MVTGGYDGEMGIPLREYAWCLEHQAAEDQMSPVGLVCPECKHRLYTQPPKGRLATFWESQPGAWTVDRRPCFVYSLLWDDYRIRSLHAAEEEFDIRSRNVRLELAVQMPPENADDFESDAEEFLGDENGFSES